MGNRRSEVLDVIARDIVGERPQRRELQAADLRLKGKWIHLDIVEEIFPSEKRGKIVIDLRDQRVAAEFPSISPALQAEGFRQVKFAFAGLARKDG